MTDAIPVTCHGDHDDNAALLILTEGSEPFANALNETERQLLLEDVAELARDLYPDAVNVASAALLAARELRERIGGARNLCAYVAALAAGQRRAEDPTIHQGIPCPPPTQVVLTQHGPVWHATIHPSDAYDYAVAMGSGALPLAVALPLGRGMTEDEAMEALARDIKAAGGHLPVCLMAVVTE